MTQSTDEMYNAQSRYLHQMFRIHFSPSIQLEVFQGKYLMSSAIYEEGYKIADSPFGEVTSNELSLTLFNENGIFNPSNTSSAYFGLIRKGIKIEAFIKPDEVEEWDPMGVFYVTDWHTTSSSLTAEVTANDALYNVLNGPIPSLSMYRNIAFNDFVTLYFAYFGYNVIVDESMQYTIPYVYISEHNSNKSFLTDLMKSVLADCFCDHLGNIKIISKIKKRELRATLTDSTQIINIAVKQSITTNHDSVSVVCNKPQESIEQELVNITNMLITPGLNNTGKLTMSKHPVLSIRSVRVTSDSILKITNYNATVKEFVGEIQSTSDAKATLTVKGTLLETIAITLGEELNAPLPIDSPFIQKEAMAEKIRKYTEAYIKANLPVLELQVRGNPKYNIGDMIEIDSNYYKTKYTGILVNASYEYVGKLSSKLTLIDASMLEEV